MTSIFALIIAFIIGIFGAFIGCNQVESPVGPAEVAPAAVADIDVTDHQYEGQIELADGALQNANLTLTSPDEFGFYIATFTDTNTDQQDSYECYTIETWLYCSFVAEDGSDYFYSGEIIGSIWEGYRSIYNAEEDTYTEETFSLTRLEPDQP